jgi:hypothetical protein
MGFFIWEFPSSGASVLALLGVGQADYLWARGRLTSLAKVGIRVQIPSGGLLKTQRAIIINN